MDQDKNMETTEVKETDELDLDDLDQVSGGSIRHVRKEATNDINDDVANRF